MSKFFKVKKADFSVDYVNVRKYTNKMLELMDDGTLDPRKVAESCLSYMSEDMVKDMAITEGYAEDYMQDEEDEDDEDEMTEDDKWEAIDFALFDDKIKQVISNLVTQYDEVNVINALEDKDLILNEYKDAGGDFEYDESIKQYDITNYDILIKVLQKIANDTHNNTL